MIKLKQLLLFINTRRDLLSIVFIFCLSLALRSVHFTDRMFWGSDTARDLLVGYHEAYLHEFPHVGGTGSFLSTIYYYPPYVYWFIGLLTRINSYVYFIGYIYTLITALTPVFMLGIGLNLMSFWPGFIAGVLGAVTSSMIEKSNIGNIFISIPLLYAALYILTRRRENRILTVVGFSLLWLSTGADLSAFVPAVVITGIYLYQHTHRRWYLFVNAVILFLIYLPNFITLGILKYVDYISPGNNLAFTPSFFHRLFANFYDMWLILFDFNKLYTTFGLLCIFILLILYFLKQKLLKINKRNIYILIPVSTVLVMGTLLKIQPDPHVYYIVVPLLFLPIADMLVVVLSIKNTLASISALLVFGVFTVCCINNFNSIRFTSDDFDISRNAVARILDFTKQHVIRDFMVWGSDGEFNGFWNSTKYWYILQTEYGIRLVKVVDRNENLSPIRENSGVVFLICDNPNSEYLVTCLTEFTQKFPKYKQLGLVTQKKGNYSIYYYGHSDTYFHAP